MLSYSWHHEARPRLVIAVEKELRRQGCDVWRDETGSSLLPPMHGSTQDCMAQAVELSSIVVVFVSKQYKESPNCRCECKYANQLRGRNKLDIVFVMMQEDYTTASHPNYCDGWLGLIIGDMFYLTLFDEKSVKATSSEILSRAYGVERIGAEPTISSNPKISPAASDEPTFRSHSMPGIFKCSSELDDKSTLQKTDVAAITPGFDRTLLKNDCSLTEETCVHGIDYYTDFTCCGESNIEAAFKLLGITQYAIHSEELQNVMQVLGVYSALDLKYLSRGDIELLSKHLKRSPRSRFIDCLSNS